MQKTEITVYTTLVALMIDKGTPILNNASYLSNWCDCSGELFQKTLKALMRCGYIIRLEDDSLWHTSSAFDLDISNTSSEKEGKSYVN